MVEHVDAVVVGAGLGGLAAGVALAGEGRSTVVLEQHSIAGGYATGFQRGPYRFDAALHALNGLAPGGGVEEVYRALDIWDRLRLQRLDPLYVLRGGGREVVAHADIFRYENELIRNFPGRAQQIRALVDENYAVSGAHDYFAAVKRSAGKVSLYAIAVDTWPEALEGRSERFRKCRTGKATFSFPAMDDELAAELEAFLAALYRPYREHHAHRSGT
ncbi:hypothetical protein GCM10011376_04940 [Nocardioides flavus (ex Wang et al. 2016)]|uniref:NAD(P)/FAD-dependent oxidoreductase n=1 Tax=Nocardioides flavus (ex Wang et al. 2016) TaxID=2058780 RepID=A0ABQ3HIJ0_9ACTN|nr:NAD(P)-binding protein [Nocardioides flavus (ex Wang et al. 2016)]GHE15664.1 hypothetical protein GCM10011376_04940 [Nocardioides flavus (ex Wang et al. 2016)]